MLTYLADNRHPKHVLNFIQRGTLKKIKIEKKPKNLKEFKIIYFL